MTTTVAEAEPDSVSDAAALPAREAPLGLVGRIVVAVAVVSGVLVAAISGFGLIWFIPYGGVGAVLAIRRPANPIGWILLAMAWAHALTVLPIDATVQQFEVGPPPLVAAVAVVSSTSALFLFPLYSLLAFVFPSGSLPQGRWRVVARIELVAVVLVALISLFAPTINVNPPDYPSGVPVRNPLALAPDLSIWPLLTPGPAFVVILGLLVTAVASLVVRARAATGIERQQLRWVAGALVLVAVSILAALVIEALVPGAANEGAVLPAIVAFATVPLAIGIAVLRYRLYDIDTIINRTVLYGAVALLVLAIFGIANLGVQQLAQAWLGGPSVLLAGFLGIVVGMLYVPIRRAVRPVVDRFLPSRSLVTMLFNDIVGSTEQIVAMGDERWRILFGRYRAAVRQELSNYSGQEVDTAGDAFFATFERPAQGVRCAVAIRQASAQLGIQLRTGLHLGEVEMRGETLTGIEVHTAARVMAAAEPGEILLSAAVQQAIQSSQFATTDRGNHQLKGVPGSWRLFGLDA